MQFTNGFEGLDSYSINLIRHKSWRLIGQAGYTKSDRDDIKQELSLHLRQQLTKYDRSKGTIKTFINHVLDNKIRTMVLARLTGSYDFRMNGDSLDDPVETTDGQIAIRGETIDAEEYLMSVGHIGRRSLEQVELQADVRRVVGTLPEELQELCHRLQEQTVKEIARERGVSRWKIDEMRNRIRFVFVENGLDQYL